jgi:hypothetical protein
MADDDRDPGVPSLEPPSLFRRRRRTPKAAPEPVDEPVDEPTEVLPVVVDQPTEVLPPVEPVPEPEPEPEPVPEPEPEPEPVPAAAAPPKAPKTPKTPKTPKAPREPKPPREPRAARPPRGPLLTGLPAAAVTGVLVGLMVVVLTAGGEQVCEAAQGTSSCGRAGYPLILAILIVAVLAGGALLQWSQVPDPRSTSFLGVGLLAVIALLFLIDALDSWWMLVVIPMVSLATYAGSHWVTTAIVEPARE